MQRLRTKARLLMFIFGAQLIVAPYIVASFKIDNNSIDIKNTINKKRSVVGISDITSRASDDKESLITYQQLINHDSNSISDADIKTEDSRLFEIMFEGFGKSDVNSIHVISTLSKDSCQVNSSSLPAWKIDKSGTERKFRLKINHAKPLRGKTLYFCVFDGNSGEFQHLGELSALQIYG